MHIGFGVYVSRTMAALGLVRGRGPPRSGGRDSAKRVVLETYTPKPQLETKKEDDDVIATLFCSKDSTLIPGNVSSGCSLQFLEER